MRKRTAVCVQLAFFVLLFRVPPLFAQHSKPDTLQAVPVTGSIKLDGKLNEASWLNAPAIENFTQREQDEGKPASERTRVAVVYSKNVIYFGIWCFDSEPDKISAQQMERDFNWGSDDNFEIMVSTFNDNRNGYLFVTNPNGALADVWVGDEGLDFNKSWNGVWDVAVQRNEKGWFAEIAIPFSTLKFKKDSVQVWGINFERNIRRKKEQVMWQGWSRLYEVEKISQGGKLAGIKNIEQGSKIELLPYLLGGVQLSDDNSTSRTGKVGGELNFDITPTLKLNFSVNTDFAQVESDRKQINLSRFSLYYPEKRQFFLEGKNYYDMRVGSVQLFYSRRIGIDNSREIPIIGGMRFFGKVNRTSLGLMSIQTYRKDTIPTTNFSVIKVKQDVFKQSSIGMIATQKYTDKTYNRVFGTNFIYSTSEIFGNKNLIVGGSIAASDTRFLPQTQGSNRNNLTYNLFLSYPNDVVEYDFAYTVVQDGFNPEMGFTRRKNYRMLYTELQFNPRFKRLPRFRNLIFKPLDVNYYINDKTNRTESIFYEWRPFGFITRSGDFFEFNIQHLYDNPTEKFELIDSVFIPAGSYWDNRFEIQLSTFRGRRVSLRGAVTVGDFYTGSRQEIILYSKYNLSKHLNVGIDWTRNYIQLPQKSLTTDELGGRIDYAFTPKIVTSVFAQWNNEDDRVIVNYRFNWIPVVGSYFYLVVNQEYDTTHGFKISRTTILGKLIWRFAL